MDKTKQKIQELVPEIMELKFGCYGAYKTHSQPFEFVVRVLSETAIGDIEIKNGKANYFIKKETFTNLGRPITLADVLLAMDGHKLKNFIYVPEIKKWVQTESNNGINLLPLIVNMWDLTKPYDDQSQETKDFIGSILQANK